MNLKMKYLLLFWVLLCLPGLVHAQGTAFNYQGRLTQNGIGAEGLYDFVFSLYDAQANGNRVGEPLNRDALVVSAGHFVVPIDFGNVFAGAARWLEIAVRANGAAEAYTTLAPRQALLPIPYAIYAESAGNLASRSITADQLKTDGPAPTPGQFLSYADGNLMWSDRGGAAGGIWTLNGADAYYSAGNVGIGGGAGTSKLQITGSDALTITGPGPYLTWHDTTSDKSASISSANGALYYRVPNAAGDVVTAGYEDANGSVVRGRIAVEGTGPYITWQDNETGMSASISSANGALYYRVPNSGNVVTAGYVDGNGMVVRGRMVVEAATAASSVSQRIQTQGDVNAWSRVEFANSNGQWNVGTSRSFNGDQFYIHRQGVNAIAFAVQPNGDGFLDGTMSCKVLNIRGGADVAEPFAMPEDIDKGSVVVIDEGHPGHLKLSAEPYDTRVAGVVSGANGIHPGIALHQEGALATGQNVALSGRVYVKADAGYGAIQPGDLLTSSETPGHAMKVREPAKAQGAILGKAMTTLKEGRGMVLVLVTLQ